MSNAAYGTYKNGYIILDTLSPVAEESRVKVIFLDEQNKKGSCLLDVFDILGPWEDARNTETIIEDIRKARISRSDIRI
jgi:hypothetical protein